MSQSAFAQSFISGKVLNDSNQYLANVKIVNNKSTIIYYSDSLGSFKVPYIEGKNNSLTFSKANYPKKVVSIPTLDNTEYSIQVALSNNEIGLTLTGQVKGKNEDGGVLVLKIKPLAATPSVTGDFLDIIKTLPGVSSGNELSSQYNVRGGSYDENLIYVNDIEIYRPQLIRSGQQEGLSFINGDLVSSLEFSSGGFEARYGDKLSSVLDVNYRKPDSFSLGAQVGMLGASFFMQGVKKKPIIGTNSQKTKFTYLLGARYRGNKNVLNSMDAQGLYKSRFSDFQSLLTYYLNPRNRIELLFNAAQNRYRFEPEFQKTTFGTLQRALQLNIGFEGQEIMDYNSGMAGLSYIFSTRTTELKFIASGYVSQESEHYDIEGLYDIKEVDNNLGSSSFGDAKNLLGYGYFINHARNDLYFIVANFAHQGYKKLKVQKHNARILWGAKYQVENIADKFKEWHYSDSSDYNIYPFGQSGKNLYLNEYIKSKTNITNHKISGFVQYQKGMGKYNQCNLTVGTRVLHASLNNQTLISPRAQLYYEPNKGFNARLKKDTIDENDYLKKNLVLLKFAFGYYYQAPFYREMRNFDGQINTNLKAQRSIHYVGGYEVSFKKWGRPFKFSAEAYYKQLDYLVPYVLDNVRIRYYAANSDKGFATGSDFRINGEFIKNIESWASVSILKTDEKITYVENGNVIVESPYLRRPTDRRVSASVFFQDELNKNPDYRMNLLLNFGSGLPYYLGGTARYKEGNTIPTYRRVDIGFSKVLLGGVGAKQVRYSQKHFGKRKIETLWLGVDVYNLLQINNVIGYIWIKDFQNNTYGVPNYLTGRRLNIKLVGKF